MIKKGREAIKDSLNKGQNSKEYTTTNWISWKGGETKTIRFLSDIDDIYVVPVHSMVDTHDGKKANFVCRSAFDAACELCDQEVYKRDSGYGIAVVRQPVYDIVDGNNKVVGYEDVVLEYDQETDQGVVRKKKPVVGIVNQSMRNFWNQIALVNEKFGSLRDYDIEICRQGSGTDTNYVSFPLPAKPIENIDVRYESFLPDLEAFLTRIGSEEYYLSKLHGINSEGSPVDSNRGSSNGFVGKPISNSGGDIDEMTTAQRLQAKLSQTPYG
jgi:hypothetical protein